ncbi:MAG: hypothetical protein Q8S36_09140 [Sulfuricurvum sp.]|nr:hypothetical protein [Sulfuricurvum sp.]
MGRDPIVLERIQMAIRALSTKENLKVILEENGYVVNNRFEFVIAAIPGHPSLRVRITDNMEIFVIKTGGQLHTHIAQLFHFENFDTFPLLHQAEQYVLDKLVNDAWR